MTGLPRYWVIPLLDAGVEGVQVEMQDRSCAFIHVLHGLPFVSITRPFTLYQHRGELFTVESQEHICEEECESMITSWYCASSLFSIGEDFKHTLPCSSI